VSSPVSGKPQVIVALDVPSSRRALSLVRTLGRTSGFYKVGSELFGAAGPKVVETLRMRGHHVFLDLKLHDIPNTVRAAARAAGASGARLLTVHATGGRAMIEAAVDGAGDDCGVLAVTVLTSLDPTVLADAWGRASLSIPDEVLRLADLARGAGARGIVCSGHEVAAVRAHHGDALELLVPGIRLAAGASHDQARTVTPGAAATAGATYLVIGRAVTESRDPRAALRQVQEEVERAVADTPEPISLP